MGIVMRNLFMEDGEYGINWGRGMGTMGNRGWYMLQFGSL